MVRIVIPSFGADSLGYHVIGNLERYEDWRNGAKSSYSKADHASRRSESSIPCAVNHPSNNPQRTKKRRELRVYKPIERHLKHVHSITFERVLVRARCTELNSFSNLWPGGA
jgi:hypothetical protein